MDGTGVLLVLAVITAAQGGAMGGDPNASRAEQELRNRLMKNYDKDSFPGDKITIKIKRITILGYEMYEKDHVLEMNTWLVQEWKDTRLTWSEDEHPGVKRMAVEPGTIWQPDLAVYNAHTAENHNFQGSHLPMLLFPDYVLYVPALRFSFSCIMDLTYWPHDTHNCSLMIGSWVHHGHMLDLRLDNNFLVQDRVPYRVSPDGRNLSSVEWTVKDFKATRAITYYDCCPEPYVDIKFNLIMCRNAPAYAMLVKVPAVCVCLLSIVIFLLPPSAVEKVVFGGICLILDLFFLAFTTYVISHAPSHTPLIVQLVCQQLVLVLVSIIVSTMIIRSTRVPHRSGLPTIVRRPALALAQYLCLSNYSSAASDSHQNLTLKSEEVELGEGSSTDLRRRDNMDKAEWILLAALLDRLFLLLYTVICIITLIRFSSVL